MVVDEISNPEDVSILLIGVIFVYTREDIPKLNTAHLFAHTDRQGGGFVRYILEDSTSPTSLLGFLVVKRPIPDPDIRFESLANDSLLAGVPTDLRNNVDPESLIPSPTKGCLSSECVVIIPSADVFYFGPEPTNTACLPSITKPPTAPTLPAVEMNSSYVYVVYQPPQNFDMCRKWIAGSDAPQTESYLSEWLSTLEVNTNGPPVTKALNYADLSCPPSNVAQAFDSRIPYSPILAVEHLMYAYTQSADDGSVEHCRIAAIRDPPVHAKRVGEISGPKDGGGLIP